MLLEITHTFWLAPTDYVPLVSPISFAQRGLDILGTFPIASVQRKYLIVIIDQVEPLATISSKQIISFIWKLQGCQLSITKPDLSNLIFNNYAQTGGQVILRHCGSSTVHRTSQDDEQANFGCLMEGCRRVEGRLRKTNYTVSYGPIEEHKMSHQVRLPSNLLTVSRHLLLEKLELNHSELTTFSMRYWRRFKRRLEFQ